MKITHISSMVRCDTVWEWKKICAFCDLLFNSVKVYLVDVDLVLQEGKRTCHGCTITQILNEVRGVVPEWTLVWVFRLWLPPEVGQPHILCLPCMFCLWLRWEVEFPCIYSVPFYLPKKPLTIANETSNFHFYHIIYDKCKP